MADRTLVIQKIFVADLADDTPHDLHRNPDRWRVVSVLPAYRVSPRGDGLSPGYELVLVGEQDALREEP